MEAVALVLFLVGEFWVAHVGWVISEVFIVDPLKKSEKNMDEARNTTPGATSLSGQPKEAMCDNDFPDTA